MEPINFRRHGDCNFHPISQAEFDKVQGKIIEHDGSYIVARGEATGSTHVVAVKDPTKMIIKELDNGDRYIALLQEAIITHTHDHETITFAPNTYYKQVQEREVDHFADSITRKVVD